MSIENKYYEKAIEDFNKVIELDPGHADARYLCAIAYMMLKKYDDARLSLREAQNLYKKQGDKRGKEIIDLYWERLDILEKREKEDVS